MRNAWLQEIDLDECSCLIAACKTQTMKIDVIEKRLLFYSYTAQTMPALKAVSQHLDAAEARAETKLQQAILLFHSLLLPAHLPED